MLYIQMSDLDCTKENAKYATKLLNGLCQSLKHGDYIEGQRNNMAVDLCILCYVLKQDPEDVAAMAWEKTSCSSLYDLGQRVEIINDYLSYWNRYDIFDYMLMEDSWDIDVEEPMIELV